MSLAAYVSRVAVTELLERPGNTDTRETRHVRAGAIYTCVSLLESGFVPKPIAGRTWGFATLRIPFPVVVERHATPPIGRDRKSTRLNSSHVKISYAVFCLK